MRGVPCFFSFLLHAVKVLANFRPVPMSPRSDFASFPVTNFLMTSGFAELRKIFFIHSPTFHSERTLSSFAAFSSMDLASS